MANKIEMILKMPIVRYIMCSCFTMAIEMVLGLLFLKLFCMGAVIANTIAMIIGAVIHYYLVSKGVFGSDINATNTVSYIGTFVVGMILQNLVLKTCYSYVLIVLFEELRYVISKGVSVVLPFTVTYLLRKILLKKSRD